MEKLKILAKTAKTHANQDQINPILSDFMDNLILIKNSRVGW